VDTLPKASRGATGGKPASQAPLTSVNEKIFREFDTGMTIGRAETELHEDESHGVKVSQLEEKNEWFNQLKDRTSLSLSGSHLTQHYFRAATTGSGKTVATINDMLTAYKELDGPIILIDPKEGEMCKNYLRCHRTLFGDLDDVEYMQIPEQGGQVPGIPFFDIRPLVEKGGRTRETAVQDIIDHYFELLKFEMGEEKVDQAFVANEILTNLIKACFDEEYGSDYFSIGELMETAQAFAKHGQAYATMDDDELRAKAKECALPQVSDEQIRSSLVSHLEKNTQQFENTTDAVLNRIRKLQQRDFIWDMLSYTVDNEHWDDDLGWYDTQEIPMLDMRNILNADSKVILIDTGELRSESSNVFSMLFLSHLYTAAKSLWTPDTEDYIANVIIEESAEIARTKIVYSDLVPKGREFNISLGLIMQYTEQVLGEDRHRNQRPYKEILNNINTKIVGNIAADDTLTESLFHESLDNEEIRDRIAGLRQGEWVVQLPSTGFGEQKPELLTVKPLPIPPGHSEGPLSVPSNAELVRQSTRSQRCVGRDDDLVDRASGLKDFNVDYENMTLEEARGETTDTTQGAQVKTDLDPEEYETDDGMVQLEEDHKVFLRAVFNALSDGTDFPYHLGMSMKRLPGSKAIDDLEEWDFIEPGQLGNKQKYYKPLEDAEIVMGRDWRPSSGGEKGDESVEHRVGVRLSEDLYDHEGFNAKPYESVRDECVVYDLIAEAPNDMDAEDKFVEVELCPDKKSHVMDDYRKLTGAPGEAVWVVENQGAVRELLDAFRSGGHEDVPSGDEGNRKKMNEKLDLPGAQKIVTISELIREAKAKLTV
jgi:hypothetical protein